MKTITNNVDVDALGRTYINVDTVIKILRSLTKTWKTKRNSRAISSPSLSQLCLHAAKRGEPI
ncbi:hypothetical protein NC651_023511 [Populus alba x Populus x berolinensis]|nr:hypothetical protein NC651_023511 [Populus alba x Populus x berolinensis]